MIRSQQRVKLPVHHTADELKAATLDLLAANESREDTYIFPLAYTGRSNERRFRGVSDSELSITTRPSPTHLQTDMKLAANISSWRRISEDVMPPRAKNIANYRNSQLASLEAMADGYDTTILLNRNGNVSEAPGACVVLIRDGVMITPDLTSGILESITRDALITMARDLGIEVQERVVDRTELYLADEVFTCGTAAEITPITSVDRYEIGNGELGPVTRQLEDLFVKILRGQESAYAHWRTPVPAAVTA